MNKTTTLAFFLSIAALASEPALFKDRELKEPAPTFRVSSVAISDAKSCREKKCAAWKAATKGKAPGAPETVKPSGSEGDYNPAKDVCLASGGSLDTYYEADLSEVSVCVYKDGSFALSWDLFEKAEPQKSN